jgi:hypothetical protein
MLLLVTKISFSQNGTTSFYKYGHNGIELVVKSNSETVIVSTFNSKKEIKNSIAEKVYNFYYTNQLKNNDHITLVVDNATVSGKCKLQTKGNLTVLNFYYEKIEWTTGLVEVYDPQI